jgi:hypothetical protein
MDHDAREVNMGALEQVEVTSGRKRHLVKAEKIGLIAYVNANARKMHNRSGEGQSSAAVVILILS